MKIILSIVFFALVLSVANSENGEVVEIEIAMEAQNIREWNQKTANQKCYAVTEYKTLKRIVAEMLIFCKALKKGGIEPNISLVSAPNYTRMLQMTEEGIATISSHSVWKRDVVGRNFHVSAPVVRNGEYIKGIYTLPSNKNIFGIKNLDDLKKFTCVTSKNWVVDSETLLANNIPHEYASKYLSMLRMIKFGRIDYIFHELQNTPGMKLIVEDVTLIPVPGFKIELKGTRHFIVSKKYANNEKIFRALALGLKKMRKEGEVVKVFQGMGLFHTGADNWKKLF